MKIFCNSTDCFNAGGGKDWWLEFEATGRFQRLLWGELGRKGGGGRCWGVAKVALRRQNCSQGDLLWICFGFKKKENSKVALIRCGRLGWMGLRRRQNCSECGTRTTTSGNHTSRWRRRWSRTATPSQSRKASSAVLPLQRTARQRRKLGERWIFCIALLFRTPA